MKIAPVKLYSPRAYNIASSSFKNDKKEYSGINGEKLNFPKEAENYFKLVENTSTPKCGSSFIIESIENGLKILLGANSKIKGENFEIYVKKPNIPSFGGKFICSIKNDATGVDTNMKNQIARFWKEDMYSTAVNNPINRQENKKIKQDYNFFVPVDGQGSRLEDFDKLLGGVSKPAAYIPGTLSGRNVSIVNAVMSNFARTGKVDKENAYDFVDIEPAKGSAYALLEGLKKETIPTDKPLVFAWGDSLADTDISRIMREYEKRNSGFMLYTVPAKMEQIKKWSLLEVDDFNKKSVKNFTEKPQDEDYIKSCAVPELKNQYLSNVCPVIISPEVLGWIKDNYTKNPDSFKDKEKGFDFSQKIITPLVKELNAGNIKRDGQPLQMHFTIKSPTESFSDLGAKYDYLKTMQNIKNGYGFNNLIPEMRESICKNVIDSNVTLNNTSREKFKELQSKGISFENVFAYTEDKGDNITKIYR